MVTDLMKKTVFKNKRCNQDNELDGRRDKKGGEFIHTFNV